MIKKSFLFILFLLLKTLASYSQSFDGIVVDAQNGLPIPFVNIMYNHTGTLSEADGSFHISAENIQLPCVLYFSRIGYQKDSLVISRQGQALKIELKKAEGMLGEVVVSGTMKEISKMDSPISIEVYSPALFRKNPSPGLFESVSMINGVQGQMSCNVCNTGDIHINGMEGPYTMILIDGMPIVSSLSTVYGLSGIPQSIIKRVEVIKGPSSTLYGSEAVAGVINVITKDPGTAPKLYTDFMVSSPGEFNLDVAGKLNFKNKHAGLLAINYFNYLIPSDINKDNFTDQALQHRISVFNNWHFSRKSKQRAGLAIRYLYENRWGGEMQWNRQWRGTDSIYGESIYTHRLEAIGSYGFRLGRENFRLDYSYNYHNQNSYYGTMKYLGEQHTAFSQLIWEKSIKKVELLAGLPLRYVYYDDNSPATQTADSLNLQNQAIHSFLPGLFFQAEYKPISKITLLGGMRYDYHSVHGSILSPRLALKFSPNSNHTIRLSGGNGFRVVNLFTEEHAALSGARELVISEALKPEKSWNGNLNYTGFIAFKKGYISLDVNGFFTYFSNQIVGDFISNPNQIIYKNLNGYAISGGMNANLEASLDMGLKIITGITYAEVYGMEENSAGTNLRVPRLFAPKFTSNFVVSYTIPKLNLLIGLTGKVYSPMHLPVVPNDFRPSKSPWFCLMNVQLTKKFKKGFELYGGMKNLLNFIPKDPILRPHDPFDKLTGDAIDNPNGYQFDPSYNFAPVRGIHAFAGFRYTLN